MKFSLIVTTVGRAWELDRLLASLDRQSCRDFEVIVVDQNSHDDLDAILAPYFGRFPLLHVRSGKGASRGRNVGIAHAGGEFISFPDDDCWYPPQILARVSALFAIHPQWDGLSGRPAETSRWSERPARIGRWNVWKRAIEWTMFLRRELIEQVGLFNEHLGPGAGTPFGAGEGTEYLIRALAMNFHMTYQPSIQIHHPSERLEFEAHVEKSRRYAMGQGRVLNLGGYPTWYVMYHWIRPLVGGTIGILRREPQRTVVSLAVMQGIIAGWSKQVDLRPSPTAMQLPGRRRQMSLQ